VVLTGDLVPADTRLVIPNLERKFRIMITAAPAHNIRLIVET